MKSDDVGRNQRYRRTDLRSNETTSANDALGIPRVRRGQKSGFERVKGTGASEQGFGGLVGKLGSTASQVGFEVMQRFEALTVVGKRIAVGSAVGFMLLIPPSTGQLIHPGAPTGTSPLGIMMAEKSELQTGERIRTDAREFRNEIPTGTGASREIALREVIHHYERAVRTGEDINALSSSAAAEIAELRETVGFDARLGYGADWYWFGVPDDHADFHAGRSDAKGLSDHASGVRDALVETRAEARNEVSKLLIEESPDYAELHANYTHEHNRLVAATKIRDLADSASDALETASHAILMRNLTPRTVTEDVYENRSVPDGDGGYRSERVRTGTREVPNPTWDMWNVAAIAAKARAESKIRSLNETLNANRELLAVDGQNVDSNLITGWDFFGQPSFLVWSFDSQDVNAAQRAADSLRGNMNDLIADIRVVHDPLEREVNDRIDVRWNELGGNEPLDPKRDDQEARLQRRTRLRRRPDGGLDLG